MDIYIPGINSRPKGTDGDLNDKDTAAAAAFAAVAVDWIGSDWIFKTCRLP